MKQYTVKTISLPSQYIGWERAGEYMIEPGNWIKVIKKVADKLYKVYSSDEHWKLPIVIEQIDDI
jgi:hypothetical protein